MATAVFNAIVAYEVSRHLNFQLNLYNLTNKSYVSSINESGYRYFPGAPRTVLLTANINF